MYKNASLIKLVLKGVHMSRENVFNQVALLALNFMGTPVANLANTMKVPDQVLADRTIGGRMG